MAANINEATIKYGELILKGAITGMTVAQVKELIIRELPFTKIPRDAIVRVLTLDSHDETWRRIETKEEVAILTIQPKPSDAVTIYKGVQKDVPDSYIIRASDVALELRNRQ